MKPIRLMSGFFTVGGWTLLSRVLGFMREAMLIALIGLSISLREFLLPTVRNVISAPGHVTKEPFV